MIAVPVPVPSSTAVPLRAVPLHAVPDVPAPVRRPGTVLVRRAPLLEPPACPVPLHAVPDLRLVPSAPVVVPAVRPRRPLPTVDPAARAGASRALRLAIEVEEGRRSPTHLSPLLTPALVAGVVARSRTWVRGREHPARLHDVHVQAVDDDVVEAFSRVSRGPRDHPVVARLERHADGWRCTVLRLR